MCGKEREKIKFLNFKLLNFKHHYVLQTKKGGEN